MLTNEEMFEIRDNLLKYIKDADFATVCVSYEYDDDAQVEKLIISVTRLTRAPTLFESMLQDLVTSVGISAVVVALFAIARVIVYLVRGQ